MAWVFVVRGKPAGSGDCIFKTLEHGCPVASPRSTSQGLCTAGRGHEPANHKCKASPQNLACFLSTPPCSAPPCSALR